MSSPWEGCVVHDKYKSLGDEHPAKKRDYKRQHGRSKA